MRYVGSRYEVRRVAPVRLRVAQEQRAQLVRPRRRERLRECRLHHRLRVALCVDALERRGGLRRLLALLPRFVPLHACRRCRPGHDCVEDVLGRVLAFLALARAVPLIVADERRRARALTRSAPQRHIPDAQPLQDTFVQAKTTPVPDEGADRNTTKERPCIDAAIGLRERKRLQDRVRTCPPFSRTWSMQTSK